MELPFTAQHTFYQENYTETDFLIILRDAVPVGRLYIARWQDEIRLVDIALLPPCPARDDHAIVQVSSMGLSL